MSISATTPLAPTIALSDAERSSVAFAIDVLDDRAHVLRDRGVPESVARIYSDLAERLHEDLEGRSTVALTTRTYLALQTAADLVRERLALRESLHPEYTDSNLDVGDPGEYAAAADDLQAIHDRHHRAVVIAEDGQPHGDSCSWCSNAAIGSSANTESGNSVSGESESDSRPDHDSTTFRKVDGRIVVEYDVDPCALDIDYYAHGPVLTVRPSLGHVVVELEDDEDGRAIRFTCDDVHHLIHALIAAWQTARTAQLPL